MTDITSTERSSTETAASRKWQNRFLAWCAARYGRFAMPLTVLGAGSSCLGGAARLDLLRVVRR